MPPIASFEIHFFILVTLTAAFFGITHAIAELNTMLDTARAQAQEPDFEVYQYHDGLSPNDLSNLNEQGLLELRIATALSCARGLNLRPGFTSPTAVLSSSRAMLIGRCMGRSFRDGMIDWVGLAEYGVSGADDGHYCD
ncbi:hypothetical protein BDW74DRAFT_182742 [Aspergillus multicolor]|uniref:uncharacterized protein n=1 Tax=Aspergillus multicolor TaxID=41759 RepID=UPI003CCCD44F